MGGSNSGTQTVTERADPWSGQQPYLQAVYKRASELPAVQPYPYPAVVPFSPATTSAMSAMSTRALQGSPLTTAAQSEAGRTIRGDYLYGGPGFDRALQAARERISPMVRGEFEAAGRYGGGLAAAEEMQALGDAFAGLYGNERQRQLAMVGAAPGLAAQDYTDITALHEAGRLQEAKAGEALADAMDRWYRQQEAPYTQLGTMSQVIQGGYPGGQMTRQSPVPQTSLMAGALGGGMLGYGAAQAFPALAGTPMGPWGPALVGAGMGMLM